MAGVDRDPHDRLAGAGLGKAAFFIAIAAAVFYALTLLLIGFIVLFPQHVPDDAPLLALLGIEGPPVSLALGVLGSLLGLGCVLLRRRERAYAMGSILVGVSLIALTMVLTLRPWEVLESLLRG